MTTTTKKIGFKIHGDWLTATVRNLWAEGSGEKALRIIESAFPDMTEGQRIGICTGKWKLVGVNTCELSKDNATHDDRGLPLLSVEQLLTKQKDEREAKEFERRCHLEIANEDTVSFGSPWGRIDVPRSLTRPRSHPVNTDKLTIEWEEFADRFPEQVEKAVERQKSRARSADWAKADEIDAEVTRRTGMLMSPMFDDPRIQAAADALLAPTSTEKPKPDRELVSMNGWISPDGKLYGCGFMGHVRLAEALEMTEGTLEKAWVKLQDSKEPMAIIPREGDDFAHIPERGVTQSQLNTMEQWCAKHGRTMPQGIDVR